MTSVRLIEVQRGVLEWAVVNILTLSRSTFGYAVFVHYICMIIVVLC